MFRTVLARTAAPVVRRSIAGIASAIRSKHTLPDLPYDFGVSKELLLAFFPPLVAALN